MEFSSSRCARVCVCLFCIIGVRHSSGNRPDTIGWNAIRRGPDIDCGSRGYFLHRSDTAWRQVCLYVSTYIYMGVSYRFREHIAIFFQVDVFIFVNHEASFIFMNHILLPFPFLPSSLSSVVVLVDVKVLCY